jgi:hypothetical protein
MRDVSRHCAMRVYVHLCFALLASTFAGCTHSSRAVQATTPDTKPEGARLSTAEAIRIARQAAERQGVDLGRYREPEAHYDFTRKDRSWFVFFDGRVARPGNHFAVSVDDRTGEAQFHGGS